MAVVYVAVKTPFSFSSKEQSIKLPILFRTLRGKKISEKKLDELVQLIRKA